MHNTGTIFTVGPHAWKLADKEGNLIRVGEDKDVYVWFEAYHAHGVRVEPQPDKPNAQGWKRFLPVFTNSSLGINAAVSYAQFFLRSDGSWPWTEGER